MKFRHKNKSKNLSFFDCAGYVYTIENKIRFVTGDKEFEKMEVLRWLHSQKPIAFVDVSFTSAEHDGLIYCYYYGLPVRKSPNQELMVEK